MRTLSAAVLTAALVIAPASLAWAGGSDDTTPYEVTGKGIQLPEGDVFPDNGHVNVKASKNGAQLGQAHFEGKCIDRTDAECAGTRHDVAQYIGKAFIPWSVLGVQAGDCVGWVQLSHYNEHFGEGGQEPVCLDTPAPAVTPEPKPTPTFPATPPTEPGEPLEPVTDPTEPAPAGPDETEPSSPAETPEPGGTEPTEPASPSESPAPVADEAGGPGEADGTIGRPQGVAVTPGVAGQTGGDADGADAGSAEQVRAQSGGGELPRTGATVTAVLVAAAVLVLGGIGFLAVRRRNA